MTKCFSTIAFLIALVAISVGVSSASTPTAVIDTLSKDSRGVLEHYSASWTLTAGTTADTLIAPGFVRSVEIVHEGTTGDTVLVSYAQPDYTPKYSDALTIAGATSYTDADLFGWKIKRIIVKTPSGTCKIKVYMKR